MLTSLVLLTSIAAAQEGSAKLSGTSCDAAGTCSPYSLELDAGGRFADSLSRSGTYTLADDGTGTRIMTLDLGRLGVTTLADSHDGCWADVTPPVNPNLVELAVCVTPQLQRLVHYDTAACDAFGAAPIFVVSALPVTEDGHWMAGRLTPTSPGGFWAHEVSYVLFTDPLYQNAGCTGVDHRAQVFLGDANAAPPSTPVVLHEANVAGAGLVDEYSKVTVHLPDPVFIAPGDSLFVAIEMLADGTDAICTSTCGAQPPKPDLTFGSDAATTPYGWYDLEPYGYKDLMVDAEGLASP